MVEFEIKVVIHWTEILHRTESSHPVGWFLLLSLVFIFLIYFPLAKQKHLQQTSLLVNLGSMCYSSKMENLLLFCKGLKWQLQHWSVGRRLIEAQGKEIPPVTHTMVCVAEFTLKIIACTLLQVNYPVFLFILPLCHAHSYCYSLALSHPRSPSIPPSKRCETVNMLPWWGIESDPKLWSTRAVPPAPRRVVLRARGRDINRRTGPRHSSSVLFGLSLFAFN